MRTGSILLISLFFSVDGAQAQVSPEQIWADQECGGIKAYQRNRQVFRACVANELKKAEFREIARKDPTTLLWAEQRCGGNKASTGNNFRYQKCLDKELEIFGEENSTATPNKSATVLREV